jgi:cysteine desulfurase family protein (TIGR01976 family)
VAEVLSASVDSVAIRARFTSLRQGFAFFDAPGGTQVPDEVGDAIALALREASANLGAGYATSLRVGQILQEAESNAARFLGCEPSEVIFGPNMTTLNFALSRTAAREFRPGDEILVSCLDHDAGVAPWLEIAHDRDLVVRHIELHDDTSLDFADLERKLGPRTKVVAFAWASNAVGTVTDARRVCELAHQAGALAWVDAVHYAAHEPIDVRDIGADVLICSPYKFCGPHLGMAYGRTEVIERWRPYKARPAPTSPLGRSFETGTQSYELLAGFNATIDYLDSIGGFAAIVPYERALGQRFLDGLPDAVTVYGRPGMDGRVPTFLVNVKGVPAADVAARLADEQIGVWAHDSWYSLGLYQRLGYRDKSIRIGFIHYNTADEVDRLLAALDGVRPRLSGRPAEDLGQFAQVNVAARDHAHHLAGPGPAAQGGRGRQRPRALGDDPDALGERAHRVGDLGHRDRQRTVDQRRDQRPHAVQHPAAAGAVHERGPVIDLDRVPGGHRRGQRRGGLGLGGEDLGVRPQRLDRAGDADRQPAAAVRDHHRVRVGQVVEDLQADRAVAGHHRRVLHRVHEQPLYPVDVTGGDDVPPFVVRDLDHSAAEALDRGQLGLGRMVRDHDRGRDAERAGRPRDALGHVPRAGGDQPLGPGVGRREHDRVGRSADLERVDGLEVLQLEVDLRRGPFDVQRHQRRPDHRARDARPGRFDVR